MTEPITAAPHRFDDQTISDLLVTAFEGGINYWLGTIDYQEPSSMVFAPAETPRYATYPLNPGGAVIVSASGIHPADVAKLCNQRLDRAAIERGLGIMAEKYPKHYGDILHDNHDADTADVLVQCALFGDIVFG